MTFYWAEEPGTSKSVKPRVRRTRFGDGYEQRSPDGLNNLPQTWQLQFKEFDNAIAAEVEAYLQSKQGYIAFDWTPLWSTTAIKVTCAEWQRVYIDDAISTVTATFEQVFEP